MHTFEIYDPTTGTTVKTLGLFVDGELDFMEGVIKRYNELVAGDPHVTKSIAIAEARLTAKGKVKLAKRRKANV